jgi:hypothetical protein
MYDARGTLATLGFSEEILPLARQHKNALLFYTSTQGKGTHATDLQSLVTTLSCLLFGVAVMIIKPYFEPSRSSSNPQAGRPSQEDLTPSISSSQVISPCLQTAIV